MNNDLIAVPLCISREHQDHAINIFYVAETIMYYGETRIPTEQRGKGKYNTKHIWDYLCQIQNYENEDYYSEVVEHRRLLGFPVDENEIPLVSSRVLQRILSGEKYDDGAKGIIRLFFDNENFKKIFLELYGTDVNQRYSLAMKHPKISNKMIQIIMTMNMRSFLQISNQKFVSKTKFLEYQQENFDEYENIIYEYKERTEQKNNITPTLELTKDNDKI